MYKKKTTSASPPTAALKRPKAYSALLVGNQLKFASLMWMIDRHTEAAQVALRCLKTFVPANIDPPKVTVKTHPELTFDARQQIRQADAAQRSSENYVTSSATYDAIRLLFPELPSTVTQELVHNVMSSTLSESRKKLFRTRKAYVSFSLNTQAVDIHDTLAWREDAGLTTHGTSRWRLWLRVPVGMTDDTCTRLKFANYAIEGEWPTYQLINCASVSTVKLVPRFKNGQRVVSAKFSCNFMVPMPVDKPAFVIGADQNFNNLTFSDSFRSSLDDYQHKKHEWAARRKSLQQESAANPAKHAGRRIVRDSRWSEDYLQKLTTLHADYIAEKYGRDIVVTFEKLTGIRVSTPAGHTEQQKQFNRQLHNRFPYAQYQFFMSYKLIARGIAVEFINPAWTSQECSCCRRRDPSKKSRHSQTRFVCVFDDCGYCCNADRNASQNIGLKLIAKDERYVGTMPVPYSRRSDRLVAVGSRCC